MEIVRKKKLVHLTFLATNLLVTNLFICAMAQTSTPVDAAGQPVPKPQRKSGSNPPNAWAIEQLKDKVDLPNLPTFTGHAKFLTGVVHPSDRGASYVQHFTAKEDRKLVLDWYKNTLNMYGWKITFADEQVVTAEMKNAKCAVSVNGSPRRDGTHSEFEIDYSQFNK